MAQPPSGNRKVANSLVAMSSAAVLAVYAAGYTRTQTAADRMASQTAERRPAPARVAASAGEAGGESAAPVVPVAPTMPAKPEEPHPALKTVAAKAPATAAAAPVEDVFGADPVPAETKLAVDPAPPSPPPPPMPPRNPVAPVTVWKDGTYTGWGTSRHGDIQAQVVIEEGKIKAATIAQCLTRYSCSVIDRLPPEVAQRQSPEVDYVSGATQSADAFYYAVVEALNKAK